MSPGDSLSPVSHTHSHTHNHSHNYSPNYSHSRGMGMDSPSSGSSVVDPHRTPSRGGHPLPWEMANAGGAGLDTNTHSHSHSHSHSNSANNSVGGSSRGEAYSPSSRGYGAATGVMREVAWPIRVEEQRGSTAERQRLLTKASQVIGRDDAVATTYSRNDDYDAFDLNAHYQ